MHAVVWRLWKHSPTLVVVSVWHARLDIRGAGNLLGAEQSGFMEDLGYETYQKILNQAVTELKNDEFQDLYTEEMAEGKQFSGDDFVDDCAVEATSKCISPIRMYLEVQNECCFIANSITLKRCNN